MFLRRCSIRNGSAMTHAMKRARRATRRRAMSGQVGPHWRLFNGSPIDWRLSTITEPPMAATIPLDIPIARPAGERRVYTWAAVVALLVVFAGFAPTYFLKGVFGPPVLSKLKHAHGVAVD